MNTERGGQARKISLPLHVLYRHLRFLAPTFEAHYAHTAGPRFTRPARQARGAGCLRPVLLFLCHLLGIVLTLPWRSAPRSLISCLVQNLSHRASSGGLPRLEAGGVHRFGFEVFSESH